MEDEAGEVINLGLIRVLREVVHQYQTSSMQLLAKSNFLLVRNLGEILIAMGNEDERASFELEKIVIPLRNPTQSNYDKVERSTFKKDYPNYRQLRSGLVVSYKIALAINEANAPAYEPPHFLRMRTIINP